jgi:DNA-3-methyladenine glycosylase II
MKEIVNTAEISTLLKCDPVFETIHTLYGPPPNWNRPEGFISLSRIILEQQVSLQSAKAHFNKLNSFLPAFTPGEIVKLTDEEMRLCQISRQKSLYLRALSAAILERKIDLKKLSELPLDEVRHQLKRLKGIGDWTVDIYLVFCLQAKDIFPAGDIAVINTIKELTGLTTKEEMVTYSEKWKPYRSLATFYLWHYYLCKRGRN